MINSMTAFSRQASEGEFGQLVWEIRSVNHRYLEMNLRLPDTFKPLEKVMRDVIQEMLKRGKVDAILKYTAGDQLNRDYALNENAVTHLKKSLELVKQQLGSQSVSVNFVELIRLPGVMQTTECDIERANKAVLALLEAAVRDMVVARHREGDEIKHFMLARLADVRQQMAVIEEKIPEIRLQQRQRLEAKLAEHECDVSPERFEQELIWWYQKGDIAEELQRLASHLEEAERILNEGGVVGRRLDFLMQEFNREANTLASKSAAASLTQVAVELKVLIEQMREQVQNIE